MRARRTRASLPSFSTIDTIYRVCSSLLGTDAVAAMNAPTLDSAAPGSSSGNIIVAATSPTNPANVDATLKYACVPYDGGAAYLPGRRCRGCEWMVCLGDDHRSDCGRHVHVLRWRVLRDRQPHI